MNLDEFVSLIKSEFPEIQTSKVDIDQPMSEALDLNSINTLVILTLIEAEFGVVLSNDELRNAESISAIYVMITERRAAVN